MEVRITAEVPEVYGRGRLATDYGEARGMRNPSGDEGAKIHGGGDLSTGQGAVTGMEVLDGASG